MQISHTSLDSFYCTYFKYYNTLDDAAQKLFVQRCEEFIYKKEILGANGFKPDNQVKAVLAASAVQLTLGLDVWDLEYFDTISLHPADFKPHNSNLWHKGLTHLQGHIQLSWKSFIHGYQINNDKVNLGLHEFSHALRFNSVRGNRQDYFVEHYFDAWLACAYEAFYDLKAGRENVFREYGGTNINEFISVCIEHFFEAPHEIKSHYPLLYYSTAILLNQEPGHSKTQLHVRQLLFEEKNKLLKGFSNRHIRTPIAGNNQALVFFLLLIPLLYTVSILGFFSGPSLVLLALVLLVYLRLDFYYKHFRFSGPHFTIHHGLLLFRWRKNNVIPVSSLISFRDSADENNIREWEVRYFNPNNGYFYEEVFYLYDSEREELVKEILENKVAYYNH